MTNRHSAPRPPYDENRFRAFIRSLKPMTPEQNEAFARVFYLSKEIEALQHEYRRSGNPTKLRQAIPALELAWREAFTLAGVDPDTTDLMPEMPKAPPDA